MKFKNWIQTGIYHIVVEKPVYLKSIQENFLVQSNVANSLTRQKLLPIVYNVFGGIIMDRMHNYFVIHCLNGQQLLQFVRKLRGCVKLKLRRT